MATPAPEIEQQPPASRLEQRKEQIETAAVELFSERGYFQTTIEDIANRIGVGKGLIYRYFADKNDLLFCALRAVLDKYRQDGSTDAPAAEDPLAQLRDFLAMNCRLAQQHPREMLLAYRSSTDLGREQRRQIMEIESGLVARLREWLEACIAAGLMQPLNAPVMAYQYVMFGHTWALKQWALGPQLTVDEYIAAGEATLIEPFLTAKGRRRFDGLAGAAGAPRRPSRR